MNLDDYIPVAERIQAFIDKYPEGSLQPVNPAEPYTVIGNGDTKCDYGTPPGASFSDHKFTAFGVRGSTWYWFPSDPDAWAFVAGMPVCSCDVHDPFGVAGTDDRVGL